MPWMPSILFDINRPLASPERHPTVPYTRIGYLGGLVVYGPAGEYRDDTGSQYRWAAGNRGGRKHEPEEANR
ncbi:hypothetical protein ABIC02_001662 [Bradyrhizobium sp. RT5a]